MYKRFTLIHSEKKIVVFLLKHFIRIHQWLYFNLKSIGDVQAIIIPLTFSYKI